MTGEDWEVCNTTNHCAITTVVIEMTWEDWGGACYGMMCRGRMTLLLVVIDGTDGSCSQMKCVILTLDLCRRRMLQLIV